MRYNWFFERQTLLQSFATRKESRRLGALSTYSYRHRMLIYEIFMSSLYTYTYVYDYGVLHIQLIIK